MKKYKLKQLADDDTDRLCKRPAMDFSAVISQVEPILQAVKNEGDAAVSRYTKKFDGLEADPLFVDPGTLEARLDGDSREAIDTAMQNVQRFHSQQMCGDLWVETMPGISCMKRMLPIERVGLYIPGGTAALPSTAIMLGVPAVTAGCSTIVLATPPGKDGRIPDSIVYIAQRLEVAGILLAGGAQAVAAMAYGTQTVPKADKIFGPGNQYVTAAKMALQNSDAMISIDLPAGPSEVLVIAGEAADPAFIASDLLSQAEHGPDSQVVLVAINGFDLESMEQALEKQLQQLPRADIASRALENSFTLIAESVQEAVAFSNRYAPEHLILNLENASTWIDNIRHAGSVFLGPNTPESLGDYASGTNHTLPTYGFARMYGGVTVNSFQKSITFQEATAEGIRALGPTVRKLAEMEGLDGHGNAVSIRVEKLHGGNR